MRDGNLFEADARGDRGEGLFVRRKAVAVHQHDGAGAHAARVNVAQRGFRAGGVEFAHEVAVRADAFVDLDHFFVEHRRQLDAAHEEFGTMLIGDAQRVGEAARGHEDRAVAFALEQRVGGDRGAHAHGVDEFDGQRGGGCYVEQFADALDRRVLVERAFREQLVGEEGAVGSSRHDVRERTAAIDPELPGHRRILANGVMGTFLISL